MSGMFGRAAPIMQYNVGQAGTGGGLASTMHGSGMGLTGGGSRDGIGGGGGGRPIIYNNYQQPTQSARRSVQSGGSFMLPGAPRTLGDGSAWDKVFTTSNVSGGGFGTQAGPDIAAGPIWNPQQISQRVNAMRSGNDATTAGLANRMRGSFAARGFGGNSPLAAALGAQSQHSNLMANTAGENTLRWNAAEGNAKHLLAGQALQENQAGRRDNTNAERGRQSLSASMANAANSLDAQQMGMDYKFRGMDSDLARAEFLAGGPDQAQIDAINRMNSRNPFYMAMMG